MAKSFGTNAATKLIALVKSALNNKMDKVSGTSGQLLGFNSDGNIVAIDAIPKEQYESVVNSVISGLENINGENI